MNKRLSSLFITIALSLNTFGLTSCAASEISVIMDGNKMQLNEQPKIVDGRTLLPVRDMFEALDMEVTWNGETLSVHAANNTDSIDLTVGANEFYKNNSVLSLDVPAAVYNDRVFIPARAVSEALDRTVRWDEKTRTVYIFSKTGMEVHFIDVGQADCALVTCDGQNMLIDGGNTADSQLIISYFRNYGIDKLDYIIATHPHEDHIGGLAAPLKNLDVSRVFATNKDSKSSICKTFTDAVVQKGLTIETPDIGDSLILGGADVKFLGPVEEYNDLNNTSLVCKITYGENSFMFTGDMERDAEQDLISRGYDLRYDVLKVGHHGSASSTSYTFLREVMPKYSVISVGKGNTYGHPTEEVLSRLRDADSKVYRTDLQGDIIFHSDGKNLTVTTQKNRDILTNPTSIPHQSISTSTSDSDNISQSNDTVHTIDYMYIGNKNSKKYHKPTCKSLPKEKNRVYFSSLEEAIEENYSPCSNCFN